MSVILLCRLLPFYAWPLWVRTIVWCICALSISLAAHRLRIHVSGASHTGAIQSARDDMPASNLDYQESDNRRDDERDDGDIATSPAGNIVVLQQQKLDAVRRKLAGLPALRLKGAEVIRCTGQKAPIAADLPSDEEKGPLAVFADDLRPIAATVSRKSTSDMTCPQVNVQAGAVTSGAALLAWIEQIVLASDVALRRFDPVADDLAQIPHLGGLLLGSSAMATTTTKTTTKTKTTRLAQSTEGATRMDDVALMERASKQATYRAADVEISGSYSGLYRVMNQFARTEPPLIVVASRVRSDEQLMRWEARVVVADVGPFRLGTVPGVKGGAMLLDDAHQPGAQIASNPFARSVLPGTGHPARLIGVMRVGTRNAGLFAYGNKRYLLEVGAMLGDARIVGIHSENGTSRAELAPLTGEPLRVLLLRRRQ